MAKTHHVVVDGSNLATEGRKTPSLRQLDEAVRAYAAEDPHAEIVVVVDASFDHRIDKSERAELEEAQLQGEIVSPPAGAIGRGDAFVLRIAERTGAVVLSNDSFQEFHGEHPWLFDEGRLVGGKPVPGVGWIFTGRTPVRGPKSRRATGKLKSGDVRAEPTAPVKAAELAKAVKKAAARRATLPDGSRPKIGDVYPVQDKKPKRPSEEKKGKEGPEPLAPGAAPKKAAKAPAKKAPAKKAPAAAKKAVTAKKAATATKAPAKKATSAAKKAPAKKAAAKKAAPATKKAPAKKAPAKKAEDKPAKAAGKKTTGAAAKSVTAKSAKKAVAGTSGAKSPGSRLPAKAAKATSAKKAATAPAKKAPAKKATKGRTADPSVHRSRAATDPSLRKALAEATAEALAPPAADGAKAKDGQPKTTKDKGDEKDDKGGKSRKRRAKRRNTPAPLPAVNEPLDFITFVAANPLGSEVEGEVVSYTSHGAMVAASLPDGRTLDCYIPLTGLAVPAPTKARQVLAKGERRTFVLIALDPARRVAELALPGVAS